MGKAYRYAWLQWLGSKCLASSLTLVLDATQRGPPGMTQAPTAIDEHDITSLKEYMTNTMF